jgi:signal transduction histidine kinase
LHRAIVLIQHQLNNPLAALLAETQLLGLEATLGAEQRAAAARITELTRRVISLVRDLDRLAEGPDATSDEQTEPAADAGSR